MADHIKNNRHIFLNGEQQKLPISDMTEPEMEEEKPAEEAKAEGFLDIAATFEKVAAIEKRHEERYLKLAANVEKGEVWVRTGENRWECRNCGHIYIGEKAPEVCPVCFHPKAFFQLEAENY